MTILAEDGMIQAETELGRRIAALSPEQRRLLELRRKRQETAEPGRPRPLPRRQGTNEFPLSFAQQRLWFLDRLDPGSAAYNIPFHLRLAGALDVGALRGVLAEIVRRHEALRTTFVESGRGPVQVVAPALELALSVVDLRALPAAVREAEAALWSAAEARRPFDLSRGPLLRMVLLRLADGEWSAAFNLHHIVGDGWSIEVLVREIAALYPAFLAGRPSPLPELPIQYVDFAEWQRGRCEGPALAAQLAYWRQRLGDAPTVSQLPSDRPRPAVQRFHGHSLRQELPEEGISALRRLAQRENASLFMGLLAAFYALLARHSGSGDLTAGTPVAGRTRAELERLIGLFLNTLVLRLRLESEPSFSELLAQVRGLALGAFAHQDLPFAKLVAELSPERDLSHTPLFQVQLVLVEADYEELRLPGLTLTPVPLGDNTSKLDLTLRAHARRDGMELVWLYNTDLFDGATIHRLSAHFATLLGAVTAEPGRALSELPLLSGAEEHQLLAEWNDAAVAAWLSAGTLHGLVAAQAARTPQRPAVSYEGEVLTYGELLAAARRLARRLRGLGVGPDVAVGVLAERSLEMVVGLLAVLEAGGAYLPLDPSYPAERLAYMLADAAAPVLLAQQRLLAKLPDHGAAVVALDGAAVAAGPAAPAGAAVAADHLAYVIYTSGSTGRPKGTMNTHRGIVNRLLWMQERYGLSAEDRVLQKTPFSFDVSVWEFFWPLLVGARLVLARPGGHQDPAYLAATMAREGITTVHFVPSLLRVFVEAPGVEECRLLRRVIASGEALAPDLVRRFYERLGAELHNLYGPTEAAVDVTHWSCEREPGRGVVPIGRPVANTRIVVLDREARPVPIGVPGELHIGGEQLARGYLGRPELTAERFVPDPLGEEAGARLYRTGDLARTLADGAVEFLGRLDQQVKLRGLRIELGEIEAALVALPGVRAAVVMARADGGEPRLVAYLVADEVPSLAEVRAALGRSLPEYMVPAAVVALESLPLTPSGKVDRKALPAPEARQETAGEPVAPRTHLESLLASLWQEVLGVESVGIHDDFFALGGTSISGAVLINRLQRELGEVLHVVVIFDRPTVAQLAAYLAEEYAGAVERGLGIAIIPRLETDGPLPLSFAQERLWFLDQLDPGSSTYNIPAHLRLAGDLDVGALRSVLHEVMRRHEVLRTAFAESGAGPVQVVVPELRPDLPVIDLRALPAAARQAEAAFWSATEARRPLDLARGPLLRMALLRLADEEWSALFNLHHIAGDAWSIEVLIGEIAALYPAFTRGLRSPLPELPIQYKDFAVWQRTWLQGETLEAELAFWRGQLRGAPSVSQLPTDRPRPAVQSFHGGSVRQELPAELAAAATSRFRSEGATLFMGMLAAFFALLARHSAAHDLTIGTPVAGRTRAELEGLIGLFLNTLVLRLRLPENVEPSFHEVLGRVRELTLGAFAHQELPFAKLVAELSPERDLSHTPLFQVQLVLIEADRVAPRLPGLTLSGATLEETTAKLDLTLRVHARRDGMELVWLYNTDLFDQTSIRRLGAHFATLLAAAEPGRALSGLPLLSGAEEHQLLAEWNDAAVAAWLSAGTLHGLIAEQAARTPERPAVSYEGEVLTYGELLAAARRLARRLRGLGVGPDVAVGVLAERSLEMVVGLLAVLEAGGAYLPLDPSYPAERLAYMLADAAAPVLLAQQRLLAKLPDHGAAVVALDGAAVAAGPAAPAGAAVAADHLAYVIYTSGSTGRPKGTMNTHRGIVNRLLWMQERYGLSAEDRVLQKTPFSFDVSVWEFFWPLLVGARLVLARPGGHQDPAYLAATMAREGITTVHFVPSLLRVFVEAPGMEECRSLRRVIASGEALAPDLVRRFYERLGAELHNLYGPTEAAVDVTYWACERESRRGLVPIGRPVANTRILIVDRALRPVPIGVPGELHIGGEQLARGYLGRPELTAERFVPDPLGEQAGARLYRTGDLARTLADGAVEFLGRLDQQVKLRGLRIELGEIEAALVALPGVRAAVVMARADGGEPRLVAYLVADEVPSLAEVRAALGRSLPEYMVPAAVVALESLPLTPSGKVDRKALPAPEARQETAGEPVAPRAPLERYLAGLWREILRVERIGVHDDFFALGGTSISGAVLINRLQRELEEIVHVVVIFDRPTVAQLAAYLAEQHPAAVERRLGLSAASRALGQAPVARVDEAMLARLRAVIHEPPPLPAAIARLPKNPPALFVLAPPRSGTTLLRVMLAGHPALFAPPELELLEFDTLRERSETYGGRDAFRREGVIRAVMEARGWSVEEAKALVEDLEERGTAVRELYGLLQEWIGGRLLVDKTPTYAWSLSTLARAEAGFDGALYVHLLRHPHAAIASFEEARIEQVFFPRAEGFTRRQLAEMSWLLAQRNILEFLSTIPAGRRHAVRFEELVAEPERVLRELCGFLRLAYHSDMAEPYRDKSARMTDGLHAESRMLGDVKFHQHSRVDAQAGERWRELAAEDFLGAETRRLAALLGYAVEPERERWAPMPRATSDGPLPLSFAQERLWFLDRLEPGSSTYNLVNALRLAGRLQRPIMARALAEVVRRHAALRTTFAETAAGPVQVVGPAAEPPLPLIDLGSLPATRREEEARRRVHGEARRPFDLARGPLARALLLRLAAEEHVVVLNQHHIVSDGWSMGVLVREVAALYTAFAQGLSSPLPEPPIQYGDFAVWQRDRLRGEALEAQLGFWRERLQGVPPLDLPTDRPRPPAQTFRGARLPVGLPAELTSAVVSLGQRERATLFMTLLAAFATLLHRYSGQADLAVGTPHANRDRPEIEPLIGFFVNTLALRLDAAGEPRFRRFLGRVREVAVGAFAHHEVPFEKIVEELRPERDLARSPLFQVMFILQNNAGDPVDLPGLTVAPYVFEAITAKFELTLTLFELAGGLAGSLEYNTDLFERTTIERMAGHLGRLLKAAVTDQERGIGELPLLGAAESAQLLAAWNDTAVARPPGALIHGLFEAQAARTPQAVAVSQGGEFLTYGELEERSNRLARRLRRLGVGPDVAVGLHVERTPRMVVALLGILKAGGAYVPLDPSHPAERLRMVVEDSGIRVLVTEESILGSLPAHGAAVLRLDRDGSDVAAESAAPVERSATAENLAYVIYTSGSTGRPKGVQLPHRAVVNFLLAMAERPGLGAGDVVPALTTLSFDIAGLEIYLPLVVGARIEMVKREEVADGTQLAARLAACGATLVQATPATWRLLLESGWQGDGALKVLCGGEALPRELAWSLLARVGELWNVYGPTETAVWSAAGRVASGDGPVWLGAPIANTGFYVVNPALQPVPAGVPGELWIAGDGVARGYLNRPDLTAEKFVPDPFAAAPGARLYRTGDLVRWRPAGELEFLGRIDHQVKVRGFRIELGEIEAALLRHPRVAAAAVAVREDGGDKRLIAYLVADGKRPPADDLRRHLRDLLPDYMVPAAFVVLDAFPLTPSGKVDRRALPAPEGTRESAVAIAFVDPRSEIERKIAAVWRDVLKLDRVGANDNFFDLGGHSLLAVQVHARLGEILGRELALVDLFRYPTVSSLAAFLGGAVEPIVESGLARAAARRQAAGREQEAVAIIGMAGRFPGANDIETFWENLRQGVESISFFSDEELLAAGVADSMLADPRYVRARGVVEGADEFDAPFFGYSPREAEIIDPQQRLFLECAWEVFENAGHEPALFSGDVGVFAGAAMNTYIANFLSNPELVEAVGALQLAISNDKDFLATRVSYKLGLTGPSMSVQTACSTSLVAVHLACQSLLAGECDAALAGGVALRLPQTLGYRQQAGSVMSPDGHCRAFDAAAGGFVGGNGVAVVLLRRLSDALRDGDSIRAIIRGSAVNNDGSRRAGYTAPGVDGQARVIAQALAVAGVEPESIGYVEAHGTGTELGDPIEVEALRLAFGSRTPRGRCLLGSVKTNIGHLDSAAGVTSLIKAALALERRQIPPSLHLERPNPKLRLEESPFRVADRLTDWPAAAWPRRAGVSSLGIGGTNAHVVLEEAPAPEPGSASRPWQLLLLSARTPTALAAAADRLAAFLREHPEADFADAVHTLQTGRRSFPHRLALVCRDREDALSALASSHSPRLLRSEQEDAGRPVTFLFSGLGEHYPGMARDLYATEPTFRAELDRCCELLLPHLGLDLRRLLFPASPAPEARTGLDMKALLGRGERPASELDRTLYAQPAVFAVEYALACLLMEWGIRPQSLIGYSLGEYVAACLAGVFTLADALALVARRARLIDGLPAGAMLAVPLPEAEARALLGDELSVAALNGPSLAVASGPEAAIVGLEGRLAERGLTGRRLPTTHAFHSRMMEPIRDAFAEMVAGLRLAAPRIPYVSNVTGTWITAEEATDPGYWVRHLCQSVRFADGLAELCREPERVLVEIGPGQGLTALALQSKGEILAVPTLRSSWDHQPDTAFLLTALAKLWLAGLSMDWTGFNAHERRRRVPLPTYPFERRRYFIEPASSLPRPDARLPSSAVAASHHARPAHLRNAYVPPASELERRLAEIWQEILGIAAVGVHDNFFELGGHSLLATQVMSRIHAALGVELPLQRLFETPTVRGLTRVVEQERREGALSLLLISPELRAGDLPLSFAQERIWFLHQLDPGLTAYNLVQSVHLRGTVEPRALERAVAALTRRHEALRTAFEMGSGGTPRQVVHPRVPVPFVQVDLRRLAPELRGGECERCARMLADQPFDLSRIPLFRMVLIALAEDERILVILMHHIVADGWSMGRVISELAALYTADREGRPSPLPELPIQYGDFALWQRRWLSGERLAAQLEFWTGQLAGAPPLLELPTDRPRPAMQSSRGARHYFKITAAATQAIKEISLRRGLTPFMTLLAVFESLLWRYTHAADLVVGIPIANRNRAEIESLIGTFVNMLALRTRVPAPAPSFLSLAEQVRDVALSAFAHQDLPFERLVDELRPERSLSHSPLFQVMFNLQNQPRDRLELPGLILEPFRTERSQAQVDLTLAAGESADGERFEAFLEYNSDLFDAATAARITCHFLNLLAGVAADPERALPALPLLAAVERSQLLVEWNETAMQRPRGRLIHELFTMRAAAAPAAPAVSCGSEVMSYSELDERSNRLANHLRRLGVGPEVRVGLCLERTPEMVVGLLGVLKAGGAYVPLDPSHPAERLALVIADAELAVLVTEERWLTVLPSHAARAVCLDRDRPAIAAASAEAPPRAADDENLAYIIYTSGSTGRPKGVQLPHRAVVNFLLTMSERPGLTAADVVPAVTTLTFDIAGLEIYLPLAVGGRVEVIGREEAADGALLARRLQACGATVLQATPATWRLLLDAGWQGQPGLKALCGGEALPRELAMALLPRVEELWNVYGPTETAIWSSVGRVAPGAGPVPLGAPIGNTRFAVVDPDFEPVPVGVPGELWIAGDGVARGYLGRAELTAEKFAPDPFAGEPGSRLYRTGDLVRWRPSGELEFLGRIDHQVKVRGFRIELGEIEAALLRHPPVAAVVVVVREDAGDKRLVAYLVADGESRPAAGELRQHVRDLLPDYMVPAAFVVLDAFPLTPSGKVDRRALPAPEAAVAPAAAFAAPRGPLEELVADIWAEVLRVEHVGADDDFFALGGHSLLATQVVSRLRTALGIEVPLQKLFATPTVAALARLVEETRAGGAGLSLPPAVRMPRQGSYPLSFAQQRMWFLHQLAPGSSAFNLAQPVRLRGDLDIAALERCFGELVRRHEALRTVFREEEGGPVQVVQPPTPLPLPVVDLAALPAPNRDAEARRLATEHHALPFDLACDWPLRTALLRLDEGDHALLLTMHHIVSDGWSFGVLVRELVALYRAFAAGEPSPLPELAVQYPDFAVWQRQVLAGETLQAEIAYWRSRLAGDPPPLRLPADRRRAGVQGFKLQWEALDLPAELTAELHALSRRQAVSLYMTLLAAWKGLLARLTAQEDILVGAPIANRHRAEVEGLIGFFLNTLMLRTDLADNPRFDEILGRVRETALGAFAHQDLPLEMVLQAVHPERDADRTSPFQIMFLLQNVPPAELAVPGLTFSVLDAEQRLGDLGTAAFEVGLTLVERRDGKGLAAAITYNGLLFDRITVVRLLERYGRLLTAAAANPEHRLWDFDLLAEAERAELLVSGSAVADPAATPFVSVHRAFEMRAAAAPQAVAVIAGDRRLTYGELDRRSNRLAHRLRALGVGPERAVGVAVERSPELIVALMAVLKAGGVYVPLDPAYPPERLAYILDDAGATVLLTTAAVLAAVPALGEGRALPLLLDGDSLAGESEDPLDTAVDEDQLVYLIYTSGSTGRPKGVMVCHGALASYVAAFREEHALSPQDGVLQFASIGFDTSAEEIYPCLTSGAALVLRDDAMLASTPGFLRACGELGVTVLDLPTAFWHEMVARLVEEPAGLPASLRLIILGGERVLPERLAAWHGLGLGEVRLVNTYGPTETTIVATRCELTSGLAVPGEVPIGRPVPGARAYVADPFLELAPAGIPGELCVAGCGLARGYLGRPDLTAERFLPDPWTGEPGARLYRTGDLVRWLPAGDLEFLGRVDDQVKVRGYRVELREIEANLGLHPAVAAAVVVAREDAPGDRRLTAYVVPRNGEVAAAELRGFLRQRLPDYMVPAAFVTLASLPTTPSGKVDRRALPGPERLRPDDGGACIAPRTAAEETIAAIWSEVLGLGRVGVTDNFFELGGHSLLLPQVMHRLRSAFQVEIPLRALFDEPTVEGLAVAVEEILLEEIERQLGAMEGADSLAG
jgi:amino acid adenylation domain-containing protein